MVVVDVLAQPAFDLVVFLEQQLEGLTNDVGRDFVPKHLAPGRVRQELTFLAANSSSVSWAPEFALVAFLLLLVPSSASSPSNICRYC
jgi:hypothetical protein